MVSCFKGGFRTGTFVADHTTSARFGVHELPYLMVDTLAQEVV